MIHFCKQNGKFQPLYPSDLDRWNKIKEGTSYIMRYRSDRNYEHHKKLFAIANTIIENLSSNNIWYNKTAHTLIKSSELQLGYVNEILHFDGEVTLEPESINFENWDQTKFEEFYNKVIPFWAEKFDYTVDELENNSLDNM